MSTEYKVLETKEHFLPLPLLAVPLAMVSATDSNVSEGPGAFILRYTVT